MSWKASSDTNRLTEATQVVHQGIPVKLYFGAIKGTGMCAAETVFVCQAFSSTVAGVDEVFGVNMLKVIEASTAPHLEPGEPQDERVQHLMSLLRAGAIIGNPASQVIIMKGPSSQGI